MSLATVEILIGVTVLVGLAVFIYFEEVVWPRQRKARLDECIEGGYHCGWSSAEIQGLLAVFNIYEDLSDIEALLRKYHNSIPD